MDEDSTEESAPPQKTQEHKYKYGIVYLSYIPDGLNVKLLTEIMSQFGEVGRIYLEPEPGNKKHRTYIEGWIEFKKKRVAKLVAEELNGTPLKHGRKHSRLNGQIWNVKYLHKFKWAHLTEQLAADRAERDQKRRFEMGHAKKQVEFYQNMIQQSKWVKHKPQSAKPMDTKPLKTIKQKQSSAGEETTPEDLLSCIFKKVSSNES